MTNCLKAEGFSEQELSYMQIMCLNINNNFLKLDRKTKLENKFNTPAMCCFLELMKPTTPF